MINLTILSKTRRFAAVFFLLFTVSVGNAVGGTTKSATFKSSGTLSTSITTAGSNLAVTASATPAAWNSGAPGFSCGSSSNTFTFSTSSYSSKYITKVSITCKRSKSKTKTVSVTVGGNAYGGDAQSTSASTNYDTFEFEDAVGKTGTIIISVTSPGGSANADKGTLMVSDITIVYEESAQSSCSAPTAPNNSSISYTGFTANWTKPGTAPTNGYIVAYKESSSTTTPADGITESSHTGYNVVEVASGTTESASITSSLTAGNTYDWWVRSRCTTGSSYSAWTAKTSVTIPKITAGTASGTSSYVAGSGDAGSSQTFTVSGAGLTGNLTVTAPVNFQVSLDNSSWSASDGTGTKTITASGTLSSTTVYFRLKSGLAQNTYGPSNIVVSGGGAESVNVSVSGSVGAACSAVPTVSAATSSARTTSSITVNCAGISSLGTGTCTIDHYGFVYGTSSNPKHTSDDSGTGTVVEKGTTYATVNTAFGATTISGLTAGQTYYIRPYAHNSCGWAYGTQVTVTTLDLSSIAITTDPTKTAYFVGETFASAGAVVTATYSDASTATVSANWTPTTALSAGEQTITATYTENGTTKTATTTVNVYSVTVNKVDEEGTDISASGVSATWTVGTKALVASEGSTLYKFKTWKYGTASNTAFTGGETDTNLSTALTGTPNGNVTVIAEFYKPVTVSWTSNGLSHTAGSPSPTSSVKRGTQWKDLQMPSDPSAPSSCSTKTFMGWTNQATDWYSGDSHNSAPTVCLKSFTGVTTAINNPIEFKAVFATSSGSGTASLTNAEIIAIYCSGASACGGTQTSYANGPYTFESAGGDWENCVCAVNATNLSLRSSDASNALGRPRLISPTYSGNVSSISINATHSANSTKTLYICSSAESNPATNNIGSVNVPKNNSDPLVIEPTSDVTSFYIYANDAVYISAISVDYGSASDYATKCCNTPAAPTITVTPSTETATVEWTTVTGNNGYQLKVVGSSSHNTWTDATTGVSVTGLTCGGESYTAYVRAKGDTENGYCEYGTEGSSAFVTTSCACTAYSFHYQHNSSWNSNNICFTAVTGATNNYLTDELYLPYAEWYKVGWAGADQTYTAAKGFAGTSDNIPMPFFHKRDKSFGVAPQNGNIGGGKGRFHVYHDSNSTNKYVSFIPTGYTLNFGSGDTWSNDATLVFSGATNAWNETEWYTPLTTVTNEQIGKKIFVGLQTETGYVWCSPYSEKVNLSGLRTKSASGDNWVSGGLTTSYPNKTGKFRIFANSGDNNWYVTFVPHFQLKYDANGGSGSMASLPATPVSCEETSANRTVTVSASSFTAPSAHQEFERWHTASDGTSGSNVNTGDYTLTGDVTLYAIWRNKTYSISATMTNVTSVTSFPVAYTYTGSAANVTYTFVASSGYRLPDAVMVTGCTYTWDKASGQLTLTGTITGDVSISISGTRIHIVSWTVGGEDDGWTLAAGGTYSAQAAYDDGAALVVPGNPALPALCNDKVFIGWTTDAEITEETDDAPTYLNTASPGTVTADNIVYKAVFADEHESSVTQWVKQGNTTDYETGIYALITPANYAFSGSISSGHGSVTSAAFSFTNDIATSAPTGTLELTLTRTGTKLYKLSRTRYDESNESNITEYLYATKASSGGLSWTTSSSEYDTYRWYNSTDGGPLRYNHPYTSNNNTYYAYLRTYGSNASATFRTYNNAGGNSGDAGKVYLVKKTTVVGYTYDNYITLCSAPTQVATPEISPDTEAHTGDVTVSISCETDGAAIYYTTDGSAPTSSSTLYEDEFTVSCSCTVKAIGIKADLDDSEIGSQEFTVTVPRPIFSPLPTSDFHSDQNVTITLQDPGLTGASIYYTTDGTDPSSSSTLYTGAISVTSGSTTIKAIGYKSCCTSSAIIEKTYRVRYGTNYSLVTDEDDLNEGDRVVLIAADAGTVSKYAVSTQTSSNKRVATGDYDINAALTTAIVYPAIDASPTVQVFTLGGKPGEWTFNDGTGYLNCPSDGNLTTTAALNTSNKWTIDINGSSVATITNNSLTGSSIKANTSNAHNFGTYASTSSMQLVKIYSIPNSDPVISVTGTTTPFFYCSDESGPSSAQSFYVSGKNLDGNMVVTAPTNYEVSLNGSTYAASQTIVPTTKTIAKTQVYIRLKASLSDGTYNGNVTVAVSANSLEKTLAVTGAKRSDEYIDWLHSNGTPEKECGVYTVPTLSDETRATSGDCQTVHYHFKGWVVSTEIEGDGTLKDGYTLVTGGTTGKQATGVTYYAIWEKE